MAEPEQPQDVIGLIPAAGEARRMGRLPGSKELLPFGYGGPPDRPVETPVERLLADMAASGIPRAVLVLRPGKWDLPTYLEDGRQWGVEVAYRVVPPTPSVPATLAAARPFLGDSVVALGFPDILYRPATAFRDLLALRAARGADLALALFPTPRADKSDMAQVDGEGRLVRLWIKEGRHDLPCSWGLAVWTSRFSDLLAARTREAGSEGGELHLGAIFNEVVATGWEVPTVTFADGLFLDVGTPEDLRRAIGRPASPPGHG